MAKLNTSNYCVVETTKVAAVKGGPIIAQYELDDALKATGVQNGMLLAVDHATRKVKLADDATEVVYLHASEEQIYNNFEGREHFILKAPKLPRLYAIQEGDVWETDAVEMNSLTAVTGVLAVVGADGFATLQAAAYDYSADVKVMAVSPVTLPNGKPGFKFTVIKG
jgi:hypothetical protein